MRTHSAIFPDQEDKILPADSSKSIKEVWVSVLGDMDRKFEVYLEDSPDPLDLRMNASLLAGQRVIVKHYNCTIQFKSTLDSKHLTCTSNPTLSIASGYGSDTDGTHDMNHFSKIAILHSDGLSDQHDSTSRDRWISNRRKPKRLLSVKKYSKRTAHTFEIVREVNERGEMGKCGFCLHNERPSVIRHIVPGGLADKVGLKNEDVVVAVNGINVENFTHDKVLKFFTDNPDPSILLTVCEPFEPAFQHFDPSNIMIQVDTNESLLWSPSTPNQEDPSYHKTDD